MDNYDFQLALSSSNNSKPFQSKNQASTHKVFEHFYNLKITKEHLQKVFTSHSISGSIFESDEFNEEGVGYRGKKNFVGMTALILDFDGGFPIKEMKERFEDYHYIYHTSTSHGVKKDGRLQERFRVILPFNAENYKKYRELKYTKAFLEQVQEGIPEADSSCFEPARQFFPYIAQENERGMDNFEMGIHEGERYIDDDFEVYFYVLNDDGETFNLETELQSAFGKLFTVRAGVQTLQQNPDEEKISVVCPIFGYDKEKRNNPGEHNAFLSLLENGAPRIFCSSCKDRGDGMDGNGNYYLGDRKDKYETTSESQGVYYFKAHGDGHYILKHNPISEKWEYHPINKQDIKNSCPYHGVEYPEVIEELYLMYDFTSDELIDRDRELANMYDAPEILTTPADASVQDAPEYTWKVLLHICGEDEAVADRVLNDLATLVQYRKKVRTTTLFTGVQGTGKGMFFNHSVFPLFGSDYCIETSQKPFESKFNGMVNENFCILVNEVDIDFAGDA